MFCWRWFIIWDFTVPLWSFCFVAEHDRCCFGVMVCITSMWEMNWLVYQWWAVEFSHFLRFSCQVAVRKMSSPTTQQGQLRNLWQNESPPQNTGRELSFISLGFYKEPHTLCPCNYADGRCCVLSLWLMSVIRSKVRCLLLNLIVPELFSLENIMEAVGNRNLEVNTLMHQKQLETLKTSQQREIFNQKHQG